MSVWSMWLLSVTLTLLVGLTAGRSWRTYNWELPEPPPVDPPEEYISQEDPSPDEIKKLATSCALRNSQQLSTRSSFGHEEEGELVEGDLILPDNITEAELELTLRSNQLNAIKDKSHWWPNGIAHYAFKPGDYSSQDMTKIENAMKKLQELTKVNGRDCIKILPRQSEPDYILIENVNNPTSCASHIGRQGGVQPLRLTAGRCIRPNGGVIMHELLHAFGFEHEHKRFDRDNYVIINTDNIKADKMHNFKLLREKKDEAKKSVYDYGSIMHYHSTAFAINSIMCSVIPRNPSAKIGQRETLSAVDIERVQILYNCLDPVKLFLQYYMQDPSITITTGRAICYLKENKRYPEKSTSSYI